MHVFEQVHSMIFLIRMPMLPPDYGIMKAEHSRSSQMFEVMMQVFYLSLPMFAVACCHVLCMDHGSACLGTKACSQQLREQ
jgi:hypothetical protein